MKYTVENLPKEFKIEYMGKPAEFVWDEHNSTYILDGRDIFWRPTKDICDLLNEGSWKMLEENKYYAPMKIKIEDEEHSKLVQEFLFSLGYVWKDVVDSKGFRRNVHYLFAESSGYLTHSFCKEWFTNKPCVGVTLESHTTYSLKAVEEVVEVLGVKVNKQKLLSFLEGLK